MSKLIFIYLFFCLALSAPCGGPGPSGGNGGPGGGRDGQVQDPGKQDQSGYFCEDIKKPFFAEVEPGKGEFRTQRSLAMPEKFSMPKPAGVRRVFILGESVAAILGQGVQADGDGPPGGRLMRKLLKKGLIPPGPGSGIEILNCGMSGYESYRIYGILKEVLAYSPDLIVLLSGNNEGSYDRNCPGLDFELRRRESRLLERYYSLKSNPQQARKKANLKMHGDMLAKMAQAAKKAGVPIVFCTLPANLRDMPSRRVVPVDNAQFVAGYTQFYAGKFGAAAEKFKLGLAERPYDHFLNFYMARTLEKLGRNAEAEAYFYKALDYDEDMSRATGDRNALIRRVAAAEGACVADLQKLFAGFSKGGLPGFPEFTDGMHWRPGYNKAVWNEIFRSAAACRIKGYEKFKAVDNPRFMETPREEAGKRLSYAVTWLDEKSGSLDEGSLAELSYIREKDPALLKEAAVSADALDKLILRNFWSLGKAMRLKELFPLFLAHLAEVERRAGNYGPALALCDRALALAPDSDRFKLERAQILAGLGRGSEAEKEFLGCGLRAEARAFGLAYGLNLSFPSYNMQSSGGSPVQKEKLQARLDQCVGPGAVKNAEKALQACQDLVYMVSASAEDKKGALGLLGSDASFESYKLLLAMGRDEEARETLLWTVKNAPPSWPKLAEAGKLLEAPADK
ncbi:MAG: bacterial transcriptional activator domain-containing protein [Elusimicrobiota bacterium]